MKKIGSSSIKIMSNMFSQTRSKFSESAVTFRKTYPIPEKMAASKLIHTQMLYFCYHNGHVGSETISTDIFKLKCTAHMPVYLFADAKDDVFVTRHYYVSTKFNEEVLHRFKSRVASFLSYFFLHFSSILLGRGREPSWIHSLPVHTL